MVKPGRPPPAWQERDLIADVGAQPFAAEFGYTNVPLMSSAQPFVTRLPYQSQVTPLWP
jgi:hypothetical protein